MQGHDPSPRLFVSILPLIIVLTLIAPPVMGQDRGLQVLGREVTGKADFDLGRQVAVIIGIDKYREWPSLRAATAEAKAIRKVLSDHYVIDEFLELYDEDATAANIRRLFIDTLPKRLGAKDSLLIFYAGHGQTDATGTGFWIASDGSRDTYSQNNWIPNQQLRNMIGSLKAQRILILADACFSGDFLQVSRGALPEITPAFYRNALQLTARQVLTSGASETVPDESEFGRQLLNLLQRNEAAILDPVSIYERIRLGVTRTSPLLGTLPGNELGATFALFRKGAVSAGSTGTAVAFTPQASGTADLMVRSTVPGAEIYVDGVLKGQSPVLLKKLDAGRPLKVIAKTATMSGGLELTLNPGDLCEVSVTLQALTGNLYIAANEVAVNLWIDGLDKGPFGSGLFKGIPVGTRKLELRGQDLYGEVEAIIKADETVELTALVRPVGTVTIDAPPDVLLVLSGSSWRMERRGGGTFRNIPAGTVNLTAGGSSYLAASASKSLSRGQTISWKPWEGSGIDFSVSPAGTLCLVDGKPAVEAKGRLADISTGEHQLLFRKPGYRDATLAVTLSLGKVEPVSVALQELAPAQVSFQDFGMEIGLSTGSVASTRIGLTAGSSRWSVDSGVPVELRLRSPYAESLVSALPASVTFEEAESRVLPLPAGRLSLPWLPAGATVKIGSDRTLTLANEAKGPGFLSQNLPAGQYRVSLVGMEYSSLVTILPDKQVEPADFRAVLIRQLNQDKLDYQRQLSAKRGKSGAGWACLVAGVAGVAGAGTSYYLGNSAKTVYDQAATTAAAADAWKTVQLYGNLFMAAAALGGAGLGVSPLLLSGGPDPRVLQRAIDAANEGIRALGSQP